MALTSVAEVAQMVVLVGVSIEVSLEEVEADEAQSAVVTDVARLDRTSRRKNTNRVGTTVFEVK